MMQWWFMTSSQWLDPSIKESVRHSGRDLVEEEVLRVWGRGWPSPLSRSEGDVIRLKLLLKSLILKITLVACSPWTGMTWSSIDLLTLEPSFTVYRSGNTFRSSPLPSRGRRSQFVQVQHSAEVGRCWQRGGLAFLQLHHVAPHSIMVMCLKPMVWIIINCLFLWLIETYWKYIIILNHIS